MAASVGNLKEILRRRISPTLFVLPNRVGLMAASVGEPKEILAFGEGNEISPTLFVLPNRVGLMAASVGKPEGNIKETG